MVEIYIELPYEKYQKLEEIRQKSNYPTVQSIIGIAVDNIITRETATKKVYMGLEKTPAEPKSAPRAVELDINKLQHANVKKAIEKRAVEGFNSEIGLWVMTNAMLPIKIVVRELSQNGEDPVGYYKFVDKAFKTAMKLRAQLPKELQAGLPRGDTKNSRARFEWHFLNEAGLLGLLITKEKNDEKTIQLTKEGYGFSKLPNPCLDDENPTIVLSNEEISWMLAHLKKLDAEGFREYRWMQRVAGLIINGKNTTQALVEAISEDSLFDKYMRGWSKKTDDPIVFKHQKINLAQASYGSTVRIMSELGLAKRIKRGFFKITERGSEFFDVHPTSTKEGG